MKSVEQQVVDALVLRLAEITITDGYQTNLGLSLFDGGAMIDLDAAQDPSANIVVVGTDVDEIVSIDGGGTRRNQMSVNIEIFSALAPLAAIADIKQALGSELQPAQDIQFQGWVKSQQQAAKLQAYVVTYLLEYDERVNDPYSSF